MTLPLLHPLAWIRRWEKPAQLVDVGPRVLAGGSGRSFRVCVPFRDSEGFLYAAFDPYTDDIDGLELNIAPLVTGGDPAGVIPVTYELTEEDGGYVDAVYAVSYYPEGEPETSDSVRPAAVYVRFWIPANFDGDVECEVLEVAEFADYDVGRAVRITYTYNGDFILRAESGVFILDADLNVLNYAETDDVRAVDGRLFGFDGREIENGEVVEPFATLYEDAPFNVDVFYVDSEGVYFDGPERWASAETVSRWYRDILPPDALPEDIEMLAPLTAWGGNGIYRFSQPPSERNVFSFSIDFDDEKEEEARYIILGRGASAPDGRDSFLTDLLVPGPWADGVGRVESPDEIVTRVWDDDDEDAPARTPEVVPDNWPKEWDIEVVPEESKDCDNFPGISQHYRYDGYFDEESELQAEDFHGYILPMLGSDEYGFLPTYFEELIKEDGECEGVDDLSMPVQLSADQEEPHFWSATDGLGSSTNRDLWIYTGAGPVDANVQVHVQIKPLRYEVSNVEEHSLFVSPTRALGGAFYFAATDGDDAAFDPRYPLRVDPETGDTQTWPVPPSETRFARVYDMTKTTNADVVGISGSRLVVYHGNEITEYSITRGGTMQPVPPDTNTFRAVQG